MAVLADFIAAMFGGFIALATYHRITRPVVKRIRAKVTSWQKSPIGDIPGGK